jgi:tetratricopeptide (TPR) repeat protein
MLMQYLNEALANCEKFLEKPADMEWATACQTVSNILMGMGLMEASGQWRLLALEEIPSSEQFYLESSRVYSQCEAWDEALKACERLLESQPDNPNIHFRIAQIYGQAGNRAAAIKTLNQLLNLRADKADAIGHYRLGQALQRHGQIQQAIVSYQRSIAHDGPTPEEAYFTLGELLGRQGQWQQSIQLYQNLLQRQPQSARGHYHLGRAHRQRQQLDQAIAHFREAIKLDPKLHWAYIGLLNTLMQLERWDEVVETCKAVINFVEEFPWVYSFMGNALARKGEPVQAAACHQKAFSLRGWTQCETKDYQFTLNWFGDNMALWQQWLGTFNQVRDRSPLQVLVLGSDDGSSLCWLVDKILLKPADQLTCLTSSLGEQCRQNLEKLATPDKVVFKSGDLKTLTSDLVQSYLTAPSGAHFDIVCLQPEDKTGDMFHTLATQVWQSLKPSGLMIFRDYQWAHPHHPNQSAKAGIDAFMASVAGQVDILHQTHQVILKKLEATRAV